MSKVCSKVASTEITEYMSAKEALIFTFHYRFRSIVLVGDNVAIINAIRSQENGFSLGGVIVADISRIGLACSFFCCSFLKKASNSVTHSIANFAQTVLDYVDWLEDSPMWAGDSLNCDAISLNQ